MRCARDNESITSAAPTACIKDPGSSESRAVASLAGACSESSRIYRLGSQHPAKKKHKATGNVPTYVCVCVFAYAWGNHATGEDGLGLVGGTLRWCSDIGILQNLAVLS